MILEIKKDKDPVLRKKCQKVKGLDSVRELITNMKETLIANEGVGLAASQVGELKKIIIVYFPGEKEPFALINPKIISKSFKKNWLQEGCLSFPGAVLNIKRSQKIRVKALSEKGEKIILSFEGLPARIVQHEVDHIQGRVFFERLSFFQRKKWNY